VVITENGLSDGQREALGLHIRSSNMQFPRGSVGLNINPLFTVSVLKAIAQHSVVGQKQGRSVLNEFSTGLV